MSKGARLQILAVLIVTKSLLTSRANNRSMVVTGESCAHCSTSGWHSSTHQATGQLVRTASRMTHSPTQCASFPWSGQFELWTAISRFTIQQVTHLNQESWSLSINRFSTARNNRFPDRSWLNFFFRLFVSFPEKAFEFSDSFQILQI